MTAKRKSKGAYMISAVAEMYDIHPQTLRLYEREGLLKPSRTEGNGDGFYTDEDIERLEFILNLARDLGVNIAGIAIILQMRERMEEMNRQMHSFVEYVRTEMVAQVTQAAGAASKSAMVPLRKPIIVPRSIAPVSGQSCQYANRTEAAPAGILYGRKPDAASATLHWNLRPAHLHCLRGHGTDGRTAPSAWPRSFFR